MKFYLLPLLGVALLAPTAAVLTATPAAAQSQTGVKIRLTGVRIGALVTEGSSEYRVDAARGRRSFRAEANKISLADGTVLTVRVNGVPVGAMILALGRGSLELATERRQAVPVVSAGSQVTISTADGSVVLSGHF